MRKISARQHCIGGSGKLQHTVEEPVHLTVAGPAGNAQRYQAKPWSATHRSYIAQAAGQSLPSQFRGLMGIAGKMNALDDHVAGEEKVVSRTARPVDGAVVPDSHDHWRPVRNGHDFP